MRILIATWSNRRVGGVETYLSQIIPAFAARGHELAVLYESEVHVDRPGIAEALCIPSWSADALGPGEAVARATGWRPDVIYSHGIRDVELEAATLAIAPGVLFVHDYRGTCISGAKTTRAPHAQPCARRFGWGCVLQYYPRRCGGLSPVTMTRQFLVQRRRQELALRYACVVTHSEHMRLEFANNGVPRERLQRLDYLSAEPESTALLPRRATSAARFTLSFVGRMDRLKGGDLLIASASDVAAALGRHVHVEFAGDGPCRGDWQRQAARVAASTGKVSFEFRGWLGQTALHELFAVTDLVVVPSVWPEPLGLTGIEAGHHGLPVAAFAVGGIREWLVDGINGYSAPGTPPTAAGLAAAIVQCLRDPIKYEQLSRGAIELVRRFDRTTHVSQLLAILDRVASRATALRRAPAVAQPADAVT
jgi:glycosyltransferase involved in cell wall biosynthesis